MVLNIQTTERPARVTEQLAMANVGIPDSIPCSFGWRDAQR
jgi:hypothetical protein